MIEPAFPPPPHAASTTGADAAVAAAAGPTKAVDAPEVPLARRGTRRSVGLVLAASVLSAALASGTTAALVGRAGSPAAATSAGSAIPTSAAAVTAAVTTSATLSTLAATATKAVVTITTTTTATVGRFGQQATGTGVGSGVVVASDGWIVTAAHVVEGASDITVTFADGRTLAGAVAATDTQADVAIVKVAATGLATLPLGSSAGQAVGQTVLAIGDPLGDYPDSVTVGIVSGLGRSVTVVDDTTGQARTLTGLIQTDAAINQGNSGGPLVATDGTVIGIITAGSTSAEGIGFAVPAAAASTLLAKAQAA